jgi:hypothetical protein
LLLQIRRYGKFVCGEVLSSQGPHLPDGEFRIYGKNR